MLLIGESLKDKMYHIHPYEKSIINSEIGRD